VPLKAKVASFIAVFLIGGLLIAYWFWFQQRALHDLDQAAEALGPGAGEHATAQVE